jgi:Ca2+-binding RTX toxin-like protein
MRLGQGKTAAAVALLLVAGFTAGAAARPVLNGTNRADRITGGARGETIRGRGGDDRLRGGAGKDLLLGGRGNDVLRARDGERDRVSCGPGRDRAVLDRLDAIVDATKRRRKGSCELVSRQSPKRKQGTGQQGPGPSTESFDPARQSQILAAGDIADCTDGADATARVLDRLPGVIAVLGDAAYEEGTATEFANCYAPTWGRHKVRTRPAVGDHEYKTPGAAPYFSFFGALAGEPGKGWYSYEVGTWHVVVLNSICTEIGGCFPGSPEEQWLRRDLALHPAACTLAYWHTPRFSSGSLHGDDLAVLPFWQALYEAGAEVVLGGNDHHYERFAPQSPAGTADAAGIRQFVVGTGGRYLRPIGVVQPNSEARGDSAFGILRLQLEPGRYSWEFVAAGGAGFTDSGSTACH